MFQKTNHKSVLMLAVAGTLVMGCAADDPYKRTKIGAGVGAAVGAIVGHQVDEDDGRYYGAVVGAIAGGAVGNYMDRQKAELERQLAEEARRNELQITEMPDGSLRVGVAADASFASGSADLQSNSRATFGKIAAVLRDYDQTIVHVVGHTDSDGSDQFNQQLSEQRSDSVANFMSGQGVTYDRLKTEGRGEREPIASNATSDGKRLNRRVDIVIKPVVEGNEQQAYLPPGYLGS